MDREKTEQSANYCDARSNSLTPVFPLCSPCPPWLKTVVFNGPPNYRESDDCPACSTGRRGSKMCPERVQNEVIGCPKWALGRATVPRLRDRNRDRNRLPQRSTFQWNSSAQGLSKHSELFEETEKHYVQQDSKVSESGVPKWGLL